MSDKEAYKLEFYKKLNEFIKENEMNDTTDFVFQFIQDKCDKPISFTKKDLKPGMVVEYRNGLLGMVMQTSNDMLIHSGEEGSIKFVAFTNDLKGDWKNGERYDIIRVYGFTKCPRHVLTYDLLNRELLWERKEPKKMTVAETKKLLKELTGEDIEIVEKIHKNRIVIGENVFTDINKAIGYLTRLRSLYNWNQ